MGFNITHTLNTNNVAFNVAKIKIIIPNLISLGKTESLLCYIVNLNHHLC